MNKHNIVILGAGVVGVSAACQMLARGWNVILIDQQAMAMETSYGNCGIVSESAAVPFNNPTLPSQIPSLMFGNNPALSWRLTDVIANFSWSLKYLSHCSYDSTIKRLQQLHPLIIRGRDLHLQWLEQLGLQDHIRQHDWIKLYRTEKSFKQTMLLQSLWKKMAIPLDILDSEAITEFLPTNPSIYKRAIMLKKSFGIADPGAVVRAYGNQFIADGGRFIMQRVMGLVRNNNEWQIKLDNNEIRSAENVLIALGPWSKGFMDSMGISLPMAFERGSHRQFKMEQALPSAIFTDIDGGYSAALQKDNILRITSGVYFASLNAPPPTAQLNAAEKHLKQGIKGIGDVIGKDWHGARPTMPDSLPVIGSCANNLWIASGSQHIGLMCGPSMGECIAQIINDEKPTVNAEGFSPRRFGLG